MSSNQQEQKHKQVKPKGFTPLLRAICESDIKQVKSLLASHPTLLKINSTANESPLHYAMCHGIELAVPLLLAAGANPTKLTYSGMYVVLKLSFNLHFT